MATQIGSLFTSITLESSSFISALKQSVAAVEQAAGSIQRGFEKVTKAAEVFAEVLTIGFLKEHIESALEFAGSLGEVSQQLGVSTKDLQLFRFAGGQVGIATEEMDTGLAKLTKTIGLAATGAKQQQHLFSVLGVSIKEASGQIRPTGDILRDVADRLGKVSDPAKRAAVEIELFGKTGQRLDTLLAGGRTALDELADSAQKLGLVLSEDEIKHADDAADRIRALKDQLNYSIARTVSDNAASVLSLANSVGTLLGEAIQLGGWFAAHPAVAGAIFGGAVGGLPGAALGAGAGISNTSFASQIQGTINLIKQKGLIRGAFDALTSSSDQLTAASGVKPMAGVTSSPLGTGRASTGGLDLSNLNASNHAANEYKTLLDSMSKSTAEFETQTSALNQHLSPNQIELLTLKTKLYAEIQAKSKDLTAAQLEQAYKKADAEVAAKAAQQQAATSDQIYNDGLQDTTDTLKRLTDESQLYLAHLDEIAKAGPNLAELRSVADKAIGTSSLDSEGQKYIERLNSARELQKEIDGLQIDGLQSFNDELTKALLGTESLGKAFHNMAQTIVGDLIHIAIEQAIVKPIANALFGGGSGILSSIFGGGKAVGGPVDGSKFYLVGENGPELFAPGRSGAIIPNGAMKAMVSNDNTAGGVVEHVVTVTPSPLFDVVVNQRVSGGIASAADGLRRVTRMQMRGGRG